MPTYPDAAPRLSELHPGMAVETEGGGRWIVDRRTAASVTLVAADGTTQVLRAGVDLDTIIDWDGAAA